MPREARPKLLARLADGAAIALVSDAGTPLVSDPGYKLVRAAREQGAAVTALPGASAVLAALAVSALPTDRFFFEGFLPPREVARRARIAELKHIPASLVLFETGGRLAAALADLAAGLGARDAAICRELTKLHEEVRRGDLASLAHELAAGPEPRGEIVVVVAPPAPPGRAGSNRSRRAAAPGARPSFGQGRGRRDRRRHRPAASGHLPARARAHQGSQPWAMSAGAPDLLRHRREVRAPSARSRSRLGFRPRAGRQSFSLPRAFASWRGAGAHRSAKSTSSRAGAVSSCSSRSRPATSLDDAAWSVTDRQRGRIAAAAEAWLARYPDQRIRDIRFDAMLVAPRRIPRHIIAAFDASR